MDTLVAYLNGGLWDRECVKHINEYVMTTSVSSLWKWFKNYYQKLLKTGFSWEMQKSSLLGLFSYPSVDWLN